jgi:hypothetical protein
VVDLEREHRLPHRRSFRAALDAEDNIVSGHGVVDGHGERSEVILVHESPDMRGSEQPEAFVGWEVFELALRHDAILDRGARQPPRPKVPSPHIYTMAAPRAVWRW